jgi:hypothetical protein
VLHHKLGLLWVHSSRASPFSSSVEDGIDSLDHSRARPSARWLVARCVSDHWAGLEIDVSLIMPWFSSFRHIANRLTTASPRLMYGEMPP